MANLGTSPLQSRDLALAVTEYCTGGFLINAMSSATLMQMGTDYGIGITGAPGPPERDGRSMGLAYVTITHATSAGPQVIKELERHVPPRRITIKRRISNQALIDLRKLVDAGE